MKYKYQIIPSLLCELITPDIVKYDILPYLQPNPITCNKNYEECVATLKALFHYNQIFANHYRTIKYKLISVLKSYRINNDQKAKQIYFYPKRHGDREFIFQYL